MSCAFSVCRLCWLLAAGVIVKTPLTPPHPPLPSLRDDGDLSPHGGGEVFSRRLWVKRPEAGSKTASRNSLHPRAQNTSPRRAGERSPQTLGTRVVAAGEGSSGDFQNQHHSASHSTTHPSIFISGYDKQSMPFPVSRVRTILISLEHQDTRNMELKMADRMSTRIR